ncbi:hypothetical protein [Dolichospermum heterosporum]|uniref:Uncharacterized protein n=1 Tax=Dolichospermum heterosporum TAC447 TaxID=747523 RepID=A0ABY5LTV0_9CYAN|nr:hypothetical protein [Dolichospermum heterosporum]UUO14177.1 hypothetical protein NG743_19330 [Dolichospermum heterosporum TAC447]
MTTWTQGEYMHFEILVEDVSGKTTLEILVPKIINPEQHTFNIHAYKGIGHIPKNLISNSDPKKRILLDQLPRLIQGYGKTFASYPPNYHAVLIIICDQLIKHSQYLRRACEKLFYKLTPNKIHYSLAVCGIL